MPELPTTPRGTATSRRILDAAAEEFAERGIAGARIDRIIAAARTNKAQLYGYRERDGRRHRSCDGPNTTPQGPWRADQRIRAGRMTITG
jgi:hypothetical protein